MPEVLADWSFGAGRMPTPSGGLLLKRLVAEMGAENPEDYCTHSCKATLLSWASKAGLSHDARRLLGGHTAPGDKSLLEYSRDGLAGPMNELARLLEKVRARKFRPDVTRSGRWTEADPEAEDDQESTDSSGGGSSEDDGGSTEEPQESPEGFWVSKRGKVHRAISKDRPVAACGYVFRLGAAEWVADLVKIESHQLCRRSCCFKGAVVE